MTSHFPMATTVRPAATSPSTFAEVGRVVSQRVIVALVPHRLSSSVSKWMQGRAASATPKTDQRSSPGNDETDAARFLNWLDASTFYDSFAVRVVEDLLR